MTTFTFETESGAITFEEAIERKPFDPIGVAYFQRGDYEASVDYQGCFSDWNGRDFQVCLPVVGTRDPRHKDAVLLERTWREAARINPA